MMKRVSLVVMVVLSMFLLSSLLSGCSLFQSTTVQESWNKLTPDEQARVIVGGLQKNLDQKFDEAKAIVVANPQYQDLWKTKIVPAFDKANKNLKSISELTQIGKMTPDQVYLKFKPELDTLMLYLIMLGMK
jgi:type II secretory pathway component PulK